MSTWPLLLWSCATSEVCDNRYDDDGNGWVDCADPGCARHCDSDGDGWRDEGYRGSDCDDTNPAVHPGAPEVCDGLDDDCDGLDDLSDDDVDAERITAYIDEDGDGWGKAEARVCPGTPGYADAQGDCDRDDPAVHPGAPELCDGLDNNCDGLVDGADPLHVPTPVFLDRDGDGFGDPRTAILGCLTDGWVLQPGDCDDTHASVYAGAPESCDGLDSDCDGELGPGEADGDGDGDPVCSDCDDADPARSWNFDERCGPVAIDDDCDGLVDFADPNLNGYTCGVCPPPVFQQYEATPIHSETWNPCLLDPETTASCSDDPEDPDTHQSGSRLHRLSWRTDQGYWRDELLLFLPPGPGRSNNKLRVWAAYAGYRVISLGYPNDDVLEFKCSGQPDICFRDAMYETTYGDDLSSWVDVSYADSIDRRLEVLLAHLAVAQPDLAFGQYLLPDGRVDWSKIVVAGWSGGGAQAAFIAHYEPVQSVVMMSAPKDHREEPMAPVDWVAAPSVTPGCAMLSTWHVDEPFSAPPEEILGRAWDILGLPETTFDLDEHPGEVPPLGTHRVSQSLSQDLLPPFGCSAHSAVGDDQCLRDDLFPGYVYLYCEAARLDPTCE
ncbi:MAG: putative metal-binding motif-containing protein [Myxococcota bacterium]